MVTSRTRYQQPWRTQREPGSGVYLIVTWFRRFIVCHPADREVYQEGRAMTGTFDVIRDQQRDTWDRFSAGWKKWDELVLGWLAPVL